MVKRSGSGNAKQPSPQTKFKTEARTKRLLRKKRIKSWSQALPTCAKAHVVNKKIHYRYNSSIYIQIVWHFFKNLAQTRLFGCESRTPDFISSFSQGPLTMGVQSVLVPATLAFSIHLISEGNFNELFWWVRWAK